MSRHNGRTIRETALTRACEHALVTSARVHRAGSRQQVRAAARGFVRRHRRDRGYLRWVLRSLRTRSALAVALLGLAAAPAAAELAPFRAQTGAANPLNGLSVGAYATPALADLDGDGDLDLAAGEYFDSSGLLNYFENTGGATAPAFVQRTGAANPLASQFLGSYAAPAFGDLDGDGDFDVAVGTYGGDFRYLENTGGATSPAFVQRFGVANPLPPGDFGYRTAPTFGDLDRDGDLDLLAGEYAGVFFYFENTGDATSPAFVQRTGAAHPLAGVDVGYRSTPALADLEGDGDLDFVASETDGVFDTFENTGSATTPAFVAVTGSADPLAGQDVGSRAAPALGDLDGDGHPDLVAGVGSGGFASFRNSLGGFVLRTGAADPLDGKRCVGDARSRPALGDLDDDGDLDLVSGCYERKFEYFENTGSATSPAYVLRLVGANPLWFTFPDYRTSPALGDVDADGDLDVVSGGLDGVFEYFQNTGTPASPLFVERTGAANPFNGLGVGSSNESSPALGDVDGDGDLDLVSGRRFGEFFYFENTGSAAAPAFVARTGAANPLDGEDVGSRSAPAFSDVDGDGDLDLVSGEFYGGFAHFHNTGTATSPAFVAATGTANPFEGLDIETVSAPSFGDLDGDGDSDLVAGDIDGDFDTFESFVGQLPSTFELTGAANPLAGQDIGGFSAPSLGDLDADGDLDLVASEINGTLLYFENIGSANHPAFAARTGAANPLNGQNGGFLAKPALGDLDLDGDIDLVVGQYYGTFLYFENSGSATSAAFAPRTGAANPLDGEDTGNVAAPSLRDLDRDGDLDLVAGNDLGGFSFLENTGDATTPAFVERTGAANPLDGEDLGIRTKPALGDFDRDGDVDVVAGAQSGTFAYFENVGTETSPVLHRATGAANPLDGEDVGFVSTPAEGDLDGDGDLDLVTGASDGTFHVHYIPEPAHGLLLGAGIALLSGLARVRRGVSRASPHTR